MGFALTPGEAPLHFSRSKNVMHVVMSNAIGRPDLPVKWQWSG